MAHAPIILAVNLILLASPSFGSDVAANVGNVGSVISENDTANTTKFECKGATKDELKLYGVLSWWLDAVGQVSL